MFSRIRIVTETLFKEQPTRSIVESTKSETVLTLAGLVEMQIRQSVSPSWHSIAVKGATPCYPVILREHSFLTRRDSTVQSVDIICLL